MSLRKTSSDKNLSGSRGITERSHDSELEANDSKRSSASNTMMDDTRVCGAQGREEGKREEGSEARVGERREREERREGLGRGGRREGGTD